MIELPETFQYWLQLRQDQVVNIDSYSPKPLQCRKIPIYYDDNDEEESSTPLRDIIIFKLHLCIAITHVLSTKETKDSLIMGDEHLDTIPKKESDEFVKSSVENLVPNPSESKDLSHIGSECDVPEINLSLTLDDSMSSGIENDDYDSEGDILILEEFLSNDSFSLSENESFHFNIPSSLRPPTKPPDDDEIEPDSGSLTVKVVGDISEHYVLMPRLFSTQPTLASNEEKSHHLLSHQGFKAFQLSSKSPMMIYEGNIPILMFHFSISIPP
uniref:Uncharacterized protein n=1 Tax=Tanacetum cinerariifolium TaxID=118510 RepID=A0A6L2NYW3_TANCI|nr:hypothetical protein [Tanacetum cinerariifolium]GEZ94499.1 hypothetical protein [Tanacetum cinerariifolium]GFA08115.1 hypothetical protein [Tanacetum cinerariifolium]